MTDPLEQPGIDMAEYRRRQRGRSRVMALGLLGFIVLIFFITLAKMGIYAQ